MFEARLRGLDIEAKPFDSDPDSVSQKLSECFWKAWRRIDSPLYPHVTSINKHIAGELEMRTKAIGRYHIGINRKNDTGHVITMERFSDGSLIFYDPQSDDIWTFPKGDKIEFIGNDSVKSIKYLEIIKVDDLIIREAIMKDIAERR